MAWPHISAQGFVSSPPNKYLVCVDVTEWMMNRSIYCCSGDQGEESGESPIVEYSFQFLEDFQEEQYRFPLLTARYLIYTILV